VGGLAERSKEQRPEDRLKMTEDGVQEKYFGYWDEEGGRAYTSERKRMTCQTCGILMVVRELI